MKSYQVNPTSGCLQARYYKKLVINKKRGPRKRKSIRIVAWCDIY